MGVRAGRGGVSMEVWKGLGGNRQLCALLLNSAANLNLL